MMNTNNAVLLIGGAVVLILVAASVFFWQSSEGTVPSNTGTATTTPTTPVMSEVSKIQLALLDVAEATQGKRRGCDRVVMVPYDIEPTGAPLSAAMRLLFSQDNEQEGNWFNFIARTNDTLKFDRADVVSGTAFIYLTGQLSGLAGVCDDPRAAIQIEETALQFPSVTRVQLYLNGTKTSLVPSQQ